ncbi:MAG: hypothetical protein GX613_08150 [Chloroflexi bacterium]|nr:hypothetical protein [Chloroflexota bacterium]
MARPDLPSRVTCKMLDAAFWLDRVPAPDAPLLSDEAIAAFNARVPAAIGIPPVLDLPDALDAAAVRAALDSYCPLPAPCYNALGEPLDTQFWDELVRAAQLDGDQPLPVRFGLALRRTDVRAFPTRDVVTTELGDIALDRLQESTIDLGWPVAAVMSSADGAWQFCLTPYYWGWVASTDLVWADRAQISAYARSARWATITASRAWIGLAAGGAALAQMGTRLPLLGRSERGLHVLVPRRAEKDGLALVEGLIPADQDAAVEGDLPCTLRTVLTQSFRPLGELYAWGGSRAGMFGRDCSRLLRDTYATAGVFLPRNGNQQERACRMVVAFDITMTETERKSLLVRRVPPGALLPMKGHIMLYLGAVDGVPFVIHSTLSNGYDGVIVSDLSLGAGSPKGSLLSRLTSAVVPG